MRHLIVTLVVALCATLSAVADTLQSSTTLPTDGRPDHLYSLSNGNGWYVNASTSPTQNESNRALLAFYPVEGKESTYYVYNHTGKSWLSYTKAGSYDNKAGFVELTPSKREGAYWKLSTVNVSGSTYYQFQPYTTSGIAGKYANFYGGTSQYQFDGTKTLGLWQQDGNADAGSRWTISEVSIKEIAYTIVCDEGVSVYVEGKLLHNGDVFTTTNPISSRNVTATSVSGTFAIVQVSVTGTAGTITVSHQPLPAQPATQAYTNAVVYPLQQEAVGKAYLSHDDNVYTLYNNVLAASYVKVGGSLYFAGCEAMNLTAGSEPFTVSFGSGTEVPASDMTLISLTTNDINGDANAIGGAEHYDGKALIATYEYEYEGAKINITWKAVLRDGSHYLRTEMELSGNNVDMYNVIPMAYNVDTRAAGSTPAVIGGTRGAVLMSDKIFAGLENPVGYNTVGGATGDEEKYDLTSTLPQLNLTASSWAQMASGDVNGRITEVTGYGYPNIYEYKIKNVQLKANQKAVVTIKYKSGNHRLNFAGVDLLEANGSVASNDYHKGYSGGQTLDNVFTIIAPNDGTYTIRCIIENGTETIDAASTVDVKIYTPKEGIVINEDIVGIQGRWSRNTTLESGETWKISAVVGLVAQDGGQANTAINRTQKRRSFLAYSERERAVPWRPMPAYISWYEININHNNAAPGNEPQNMKSEQVVNVMNHWKTDFYDKYGMAPVSFVIDDGWDNYGTWTFHSGFPNEMRDMAAVGEEMGAGVGAWLGPVGGYGQSGNYRRQYWSNMGQSMVLGNPNYYKVFKDAAYNLTQNQGNFNFFKFDGISAQFSATGPDNGDSGNENAEGIIRLERYVREELKRDIFFNTTVGTWASPFWYHYTDATWRQENDFGKIGNNTIDRENWITYRDRLVYQNYVTNSPICPINTLMTHGFILHDGDGTTMSNTYAHVRREMRCAFVCGSGMVELYNDYALMNSINNGKLWSDLADLMRWQQRNADVLPDAHWVGGNPWDGSKANIYGWASWNGTKSTLALRNGASAQQTLTITLREALEIPANVSGSIILTKSFADQATLKGLTEGEPIDIDTPLPLTLSASSLYVFEGLDANATSIGSISIPAEDVESTKQHTAYDNKYYDIAGRRLASPAKTGVYIVNGKKIIL